MNSHAFATQNCSKPLLGKEDIRINGAFIGSIEKRFAFSYSLYMIIRLSGMQINGVDVYAYSSYTNVRAFRRRCGDLRNWSVGELARVYRSVSEPLARRVSSGTYISLSGVKNTCLCR